MQSSLAGLSPFQNLKIIFGEIGRNRCGTTSAFSQIRLCGKKVPRIEEKHWI